MSTTEQPTETPVAAEEVASPATSDPAAAGPAAGLEAEVCVTVVDADDHRDDADSALGDVLGVDLSPIQPDLNLTPGGYIEHSDVTFPCGCDDGTLPEDSALKKWGEMVLSASQKIGRPLDSAIRYKQEMEEAGFVDIVEYVDLWPINKWPKDPKYKELGLWNNENLVGGLSGLSMALFTRVHNWSTQELEAFLVDVRKDMKNTKIHSYITIIPSIATMVLTLYGSAMSTARVHVVLLELALEYKHIPIDISKGEQKHPSYMKMQPFGKVPVLDDDGLVIYESRAICRYLAR
ncbi:putative glutathione S-transferase GSTF2 [Glarea lozoyensis 74030]|uniref:glutathione transferase n=1 Tax=Glarea lozoyensis (strain ATCC 74030 / MF5533) TaxID=1104152 RepID=H0EIN5_GLAL7|nr:putative glutathione S-transferase GSTF2 [Glarea lozoyensis 74030]